MTTSASARSDVQSSPTWVLWLFGIALIVLFIWLWNTANSAKATAEANAALLAQPQVDLHYLVGGPTRFGEQFEEAVEDAELDEFSSEEFLWSTVLVANEGQGELDGALLRLNLVEGAQPTVLAALPSFGSGIDTEETEAGLEIDLREIGDGEVARVFLGFSPEALPDSAAANWASSYQSLLSSLVVEAGDFSETFYGRGY